MTTARNVLVLAPHADDETLGMGGTIARLAGEGAHITVAVLTGPGEHEHPVFPRSSWDTIRAEARDAFAILGVHDTVFENIPAALVGDQPAHEVNAVVERVVRDAAPDELFVPFPFDLHRDHRELFHAASVAWRPKSEAGRRIRRVACYEVLSETHWNAPYLEAGFLPQLFVDISATLEKKLAALRCFKSQLIPGVRSVEGVEALARLRGAQIGTAAAEGFVVIRELHGA